MLDPGTEKSKYIFLLLNLKIKQHNVKYMTVFKTHLSLRNPVFLVPFPFISDSTAPLRQCSRCSNCVSSYRVAFWQSSLL